MMEETLEKVREMKEWEQMLKNERERKRRSSKKETCIHCD